MSGARAAKLSAPELRAALDALPGWTLRDGKLRRELRFRDFSEAFGFMTRAALAAEAMDHHPEWRNVWNRVDIELVTHDAGGVTELDLTLARKLNELAGSSS